MNGECSQNSEREIICNENSERKIRKRQERCTGIPLTPPPPSKCRLIISCVYCIFMILAGNYCLNVDRSLNIPSNGLVFVVFVRYLLVSHWSINAVAFRCTVWAVWGDLNRCGIFHGFVCRSSLCD